MKINNLLFIIIFLFSFLLNSNAYSYSMQPLSNIILDNKENSLDDTLKVLLRCNAWNNMLATMGQEAGNNEVYNKHFEISLFFYNTIIDTLVELGKKESLAEKETQDKLFKLDANYRADGKKNVQEYGIWFEGYFKGEFGDANICDRYYELLKN